MDTLLLCLLRVDIYKTTDSGKRVFCIIVKYSREFYLIIRGCSFCTLSVPVVSAAVIIQPLLCTLVKWSCYCNISSYSPPPLLKLSRRFSSIGTYSAFSSFHSRILRTRTSGLTPSIRLVLGISLLLVHSDFEIVSFLLGYFSAVLNRRHSYFSLLAFINFYIGLYIQLI
jgi:hypothetical protein